jgi:hypothetical protein
MCNRAQSHERLKEKPLGKEIRIIKKNRSKVSGGYTFIDDGLVDLAKPHSDENDSNPSSSDDKKYKQYVLMLRNNPKKDMKSRGRSRLVGGGLSTKSHSPVYE